MIALFFIFFLIAVESFASIPFLNLIVPYAISSTSVSPIVASALKKTGSKNFSPEAAPATNLEKEIGYNPTSKIAPPAKSFRNNLESKIDNSLKVEESISPKEDTPPKEDTSPKEDTPPKIQEFTDPETGEENPNFIYDKITLKTNCDKSSEDVQNEEIPHLEPEPSNPPSPVDEKVKTPVEDSNKKEDSNEKEDSDKEENKRDEEISKGKLIIITSKKIKYYAYENESPQIVYEFNGNKITDKPLGERKRLENGKHRVNLFSS